MGSRHRHALRKRVAREVLGSSVIRVFAPKTKGDLLEALHRVPVDDLLKIGKDGFRSWYETQLEHVAGKVRMRNSHNSRVLPGLKWGHSSKVLCLYLRGLVEHTHYFADSQAATIAHWLHAPIDGIVIRRLRKLGVTFSFRQIRAIDSPAKFYEVQDQLEQAAARAGVPRVWFDDIWADRA